jgi:hypothetical protein
MASISVELGPQAKTKQIRVSVSVTSYPVTAQFTGIAFRAQAHLFSIESTTQIASFSKDGTNDFLVLNGAVQTAAVLDKFHVDEVFIHVDTGTATIQILAWA